MRITARVTSTDVVAMAPPVAILPVGSFEQHGSHLPLATDAIIANAMVTAIAEEYGLLALPPIMVACSHEHEGFAGTVSISASTLNAIIVDIQASLARGGIDRLIVVNAHGGNYVLSNVVQEANAERPGSMGLYPGRKDWEQARNFARLETTHTEDMHGGELETSILLYLEPTMVDDSYRKSDHIANERDYLLVGGMASLAENGIIGKPSLATADKGNLVLTSLTSSFGSYLQEFLRYRG